MKIYFLNMNMDLKNPETKGQPLIDFMVANDFKNCVRNYTRICKSYFKSTNEYRTSKTLIDVVLYNKEIVTKTSTISCPFSDHHFVLVQLKFASPAKVDPYIDCRNLNEKTILSINEKITRTDWSLLDNFDCISEKWLFFKKK